MCSFRPNVCTAVTGDFDSLQYLPPFFSFFSCVKLFISVYTSYVSRSLYITMAKDQAMPPPGGLPCNYEIVICDDNVTLTTVTGKKFPYMSLTPPSTLDSPPTDINLTVHNYVQNSPVLSRASQDKLLSQGRRLVQNALSTSVKWRNAKIVPSLACFFEPKISLFFFR